MLSHRKLPVGRRVVFPIPKFMTYSHLFYLQTKSNDQNFFLCDSLKNFADQDLSETTEMDEYPLLLFQLKPKSCVRNENQILHISAKEIRNSRMAFPCSWPAAAGLFSNTQLVSSG